MIDSIFLGFILSCFSYSISSMGNSNFEIEQQPFYNSFEEQEYRIIVSCHKAILVVVMVL